MAAGHTIKAPPNPNCQTCGGLGEVVVPFSDEDCPECYQWADPLGTKRAESDTSRNARPRRRWWRRLWPE